MTLEAATTLPPEDAPPLTKYAIVSALTSQRADIAKRIARWQASRREANAAIKSARAELADVERLLAAAKPRTRKPKVAG